MPVAYQLIQFTTAFLLIALASLIFFQRPKEKQVQVFAAFIVSMALWIVSLYLYYYFSDPTIVLFVGRWNFVFGDLIGYFAFLFVYLFPTTSIRVPRNVMLAIKAATILLVIMTVATDLIVENEYVMGVNRVTSFGDYYFLYALHFLSLSVASIVFLVLKYRKSDAEHKKQLLIFAGGWGFTLAFAATTNVLLPALTGNYDLQNIGPAATLVLAIATGYALAKHQLLNIKTIAVEFFVVFLLLLFVTNIATASTTVGVAVGVISLMFGVVLGYALIRSVRNEVRRREEVQELASQLEVANAHLKELDDAKNDFISIASHQLRTPVSVIKGYLSLLMDGTYGKLSVAAREKITRMFTTNERLVQLINNLLNVSRIEKNKIEYVMGPVDAADLLERTVEEMRLRASDKGITLEIKMPAKSLPPIHGDAGKLHEVMVNLIDNAVKYSHRGTISVGAGLSEDRKNIILRIKDAGVGMTAEQSVKLFEKFYRVKSPVTATEAGTGLGLYICAKFVQGMGGKIYVEKSVAGKGTTFAVEIPAAKP